jgi:hypothetical protein
MLHLHVSIQNLFDVRFLLLDVHQKCFMLSELMKISLHSRTGTSQILRTLQKWLSLHRIQLCTWDEIHQPLMSVLSTSRAFLWKLAIKEYHSFSAGESRP